MQFLNMKIGASLAMAALGTASLFAQTSRTARPFQRQGQFQAVMGAALNLTDAQKGQVESIFQTAQQSAQPIRQQLKQTRQSLEAAVKAGNSDQIQQLSATEGSQLGQLAGIRSSAHAQMYKILTPEQQQKLSTLRAAMHHSRRGPAGGAVQN
jgi:Spy/CpxP family protein refolding chaperone